MEEAIIAYEFVRDGIPPSFDIKRRIITAKARTIEDMLDHIPEV